MFILQYQRSWTINYQLEHYFVVVLGWILNVITLKCLEYIINECTLVTFQKS